MFQHPTTLDLIGRARRDELLREAYDSRLARSGRSSSGESPFDRIHLRLAAAAATVLAAIAIVAN